MAWPHGREGHRTHDILDFLGATGIWECWRAQKDLCPPRAQSECLQREKGGPPMAFNFTVTFWREVTAILGLPPLSSPLSAQSPKFRSCVTSSKLPNLSKPQFSIL